MALSDSSLRFWRRGSTEIPMVRASLRGMLASFSSAREKPRPARTRRLYLTVGQRTMGRSLSTGLGATRAAFSLRVLRRLAFLPGYDCWVRTMRFIHCRRRSSQGERGITWSKCTRTRRCQSLRKSAKRESDFAAIRGVSQGAALHDDRTVLQDRVVSLDCHCAGI